MCVWVGVLSIITFCTPNINFTLLNPSVNKKCLAQNGLMQITALPCQIDGNQKTGHRM